MASGMEYFVIYLISRSVYQIMYMVFREIGKSPQDLFAEYNRLLSVSDEDLRATFDDYQLVEDFRFARQVLGHIALGQGGSWVDGFRSVDGKEWSKTPIVIGRDINAFAEKKWFWDKGVRIPQRYVVTEMEKNRWLDIAIGTRLDILDAPSDRDWETH